MLYRNKVAIGMVFVIGLIATWFSFFHDDSQKYESVSADKMIVNRIDIYSYFKMAGFDIKPESHSISFRPGVRFGRNFIGVVIYSMHRKTFNRDYFQFFFDVDYNLLAVVSYKKDLIQKMQRYHIMTVFEKNNKIIIPDLATVVYKQKNINIEKNNYSIFEKRNVMVRYDDGKNIFEFKKSELPKYVKNSDFVVSNSGFESDIFFDKGTYSTENNFSQLEEKSGNCDYIIDQGIRYDNYYVFMNYANNDWQRIKKKTSLLGDVNTRELTFTCMEMKKKSQWFTGYRHMIFETGFYNLNNEELYLILSENALFKKTLNDEKLEIGSQILFKNKKVLLFKDIYYLQNVGVNNTYCNKLFMHTIINKDKRSKHKKSFDKLIGQVNNESSKSFSELIIIDSCKKM